MLKTECLTLRNGYDGKTCYVHSRAGVFPNGEGVMTIQKLNVFGMDTFMPIEVMSYDGKSWQMPKPQVGFTPLEKDGHRVVVCDFTPKYHSKTKTMLGTGHCADYSTATGRLIRDDTRIHGVTYSVFDESSGNFKGWKMLTFPQFQSIGAGCAQRVDLEDGTILLPHYARNKNEKNYCVLVAKYSFDGEDLSMQEMGKPIISHTDSRGIYEPSLVQFKGKFYLTMRTDFSGYVSVSDDGLNFSQPKEWFFDDGQPVNIENTQQHFMKLKDKLYLVYTRKGLNNDHVFRHRAPLVCAEINTEKLVLKRETEIKLTPERGARLGNFGVTEVSDNEAWVTVCEWMQPLGCEKYGSDNSTYLVKVTDE